MLYITTCPLAVKGSRLERGAEVELTKEEALQFDPNDITPAVAAPQEPEPEPEPEIVDMTISQLKAKATALGLSGAGSKADLTERIALHLQAN